MKSPITGKEMKIMCKEDVLEVRKEIFPILFHHYVCEDTGEIFTDEQQENLNLTQAYNQYRNKYNLPFPDEIRDVREQYAISAAKMAEILGFGTNVYRNYESGELPSISNARLIQLARDPAEFKKLLRASNALAGNTLEKLEQRIDELIKCQADFRFVGLPMYLMAGLRNGKAGIYTGYRTPNLNRFIEMIVYFTENCKPWKTKMNKLLFYADFLHYKQTGFSISGAEYIAIQLGPVPLNFSSIFEYAAVSEKVTITYQEFQNGGIGELFSPYPGHSFDVDLFDQNELDTLQNVVDKFKDAPTNDVVKWSHDELAWSENFNEKKKISYDYAFKLMHA